MKRKNYYTVLILLISFVLFTNIPVFATEADVATANSEQFGIFTLIPPVVAIVLAFITKNVVASLFIGTLAGCIMLQLSGYNIFMAIVHGFLNFGDRALNSLADPWNAGIVLQVLVIGGVIHLVGKMGGAKAIAEKLATKAKGPISTQLITWVLGLLVFFDDYANSLIAGPIMRPVCDKMKISRERLAFIVDATAAPIAGLAIISTWIGLEVGLINDAFVNGVGQEVDAFGVFLQTIPYRFYNILILAFVVISAVKLREFGPMLEAERNARKGIISDNDTEIDSKNNDLEPKEGVKLSIWNAIIPIGTLIVSSFIGFYYNGRNVALESGEEAITELFANNPLSFAAIQEAFSNADASVVLFQAALFASIVAIILGVSKKIFTLGEAIEVWIDGMKGLVVTGVILILAWSLSSVIKDLGTAKYLVNILSTAIPMFLLPSLIFILGAVMSFATGTAYGTMGIIMPLAIPLGYSVSNGDMSFVIVCTSAVLTGAIFGDHCSPISDTTILSSMGAGCDHIKHVKTQMIYALVVGAITVLLGYIPAGLGLPIYIILPLALIGVYAVVMIFGKKIEDTDLKL